MADNTEKSTLEEIVERFNTAGIEFILIGGQAELLHGSARNTFDFDFCYRRTPENLDRIARCIQSIHPTLRNAPPDLPFVIDAQSLALGCNFTFDTDLGPLDLLGYLEPIGGYDELVSNADSMKLGETELSIASLDDLITIKEHVARPKDREALMHLRAIKQVRDEK